jgi:hypothetical protein
VAQQHDNGEGLFITDNSGNYYYFRPETLAQAKMTDEDIARVKQEAAKRQSSELSADDLKAVAGGMSAQIPGILNVGTIPSVKGGPVMTSTIMCPW